MKKIALISEGSYVHIDFFLIPFLSQQFEIGWFPFFDSSTSDSQIQEFINRSASVTKSIFVYKKLSNRMRTFSTRSKLIELLLSVQNWKPDVVYVNADAFPWLPILIKKFFVGIPVIAAIHDVKAHSGTSFITHLYKPLLPYFYNRLNTYSDFSYKQLNKKKLIKRKVISCCRHPFTGFGDLQKKQHDKFTILFFGNLIAYKGLSLLLSAGKFAYEHNSNICIKIVGRGPDEFLLEPYKSHPCFNIINRRISDSEIPEIFSDVDCLALPYKDATQSGPMMIALNYAIPVLATNIPAFKEYEKNFSLVQLIDNNIEVWGNKFVELSKLFPNVFSIDQIERYKNEINSTRESIKKEWLSLFSNCGYKNDIS